MSSVADPAALDRLVERLGALGSEASAAWGTLTAHEMLCHLADANASVLESPSGDEDSERHRFMKWLALRAPVPWPRSLQTPPEVDPKAEGTKPSDFDADRERAIRSLRDLAAAPAASLAPSHGAFGPMSAKDWHRWAYRHTDHHLRQFGC